ncbi:MAG: hypothetical protein JXA42_10190 [Anaerolineales bacterium]|nr:hypothetical protein [Anaerolineales bacterium]
MERSIIALVIAIAIFILDGVLWLVSVSTQGYSPSIGGLIARFFLLIPLVQGIGAIRTVRNRNAEN